MFVVFSLFFIANPWFCFARIKNSPDKAFSGRYVVIKGVDALNRVEKRLYAAGIDVRGGLYRAQSTLWVAGRPSLTDKIW